jgi:hypothetical protein
VGLDNPHYSHWGTAEVRTATADKHHVEFFFGHLVEVNVQDANIGVFSTAPVLE